MIHKTVDARGLQCPLPILRAKKALAEVPLGGEMEVLSTDPGSKADFAAFARQTGNELVASEERDEHFRYVIKRNS